MEHKNCCSTTCDKQRVANEFEKLKQERDEAMAYSERLRDAFVNLRSQFEECFDEPDFYLRRPEWARADEKPPAALAVLKAEWQADGVLKFAGHAMVKYRYDFCDWAKLFANELRQRAQEAGDEMPLL